MRKAVDALVLASFLAGCAGSQPPVLSGGPVLSYDWTRPPSVVPPGFIPSYELAGRVEIPAGLKSAFDSTLVPVLLIGAEGEVEFRKEGGRSPEGKVLGSKYYFRGTLMAAEYWSACGGLFSFDPNIQIEICNARGERIRIVARLEPRGMLTGPAYGEDDYWKVWEK